MKKNLMMVGLIVLCISSAVLVTVHSKSSDGYEGGEALRINHSTAGEVTEPGAGSSNYSLFVSLPQATPPGSPTYDSVLKAPKCTQSGSACDSGTLLNGRDTMSGGAEPNQPNTINNSCADGTSGTYHADESIDSIKVSTLDATNLAPGKTVKIEVKIWVWSTVSDHLDLYYAANANNPSWVLIGTINAPGSASQVLSTTYQLPAGSLQAVRARWRFQGAVASCATNSGYDDYDDLIFPVGGAADADNDGVPDATDNCPTTANPNQADGDGDGIGNACDPNLNDGPTGDLDNDSVLNNADNCPNIANLSQSNNDGDALGDACDPDDDNDGVLDGADNCPFIANAGQADGDGDGIGNACDPNPNDGPTGDLDADGVLNNADNCPNAANPNQANNDGDAQGDVCDPDDDNDGVLDGADNCPTTANPNQADGDGDGIGNACDSNLNDGPTGDPDADSVPNNADNCPNAANPNQANNDGDAQGDVCDPDDDNDTVLDGPDNCPFSANANQADGDGDGIGNACDPNLNDGPTGDLDTDGVLNNADNCPNAANANQANNDGDSLGDVCDPDDDNDGVLDGVDNCPFTANGDQADGDGDNIGNACDPNLNDGPSGDLDADSVLNNADNCPNMANTNQANNDGDALGDVCDPDDDNDGVLDGADNCPFAANADQADGDGDGIGNACDPNLNDGPTGDLDTDGILNNADNCPNVANTNQANNDGDALGDACDPDDDNDGVLDGADNCSFAANPDQADGDGDNIGNACDPNLNDGPSGDLDADSVLNNADNCPNAANTNQANNDGDALGDVCDPDDDNDGVVDGTDNCPFAANADQADGDGDGIGNACDSNLNDGPTGDLDADSVPNNADNCPNTANTNQANNDGDALGDVCDPDDDNDGVLDGTDNCPFAANADQTDGDGDNIGNACDSNLNDGPTGDLDADGVLNNADNCPNAANTNQANNDGDALGDVCDPDDDNDGVLDGADNCPFAANADQTDRDGDNIGNACDPNLNDGPTRTVLVPTFSSPAIAYGDTPTILSGKISAGSSFPTGNVSITLNGVTQQAAIQSDGTFSSSFATGGLATSGSPYPITYAYAGDSTYEGVTDSSAWLTVNKATAVVTLSNLSYTFDGTAKFATAATNPAGLNVNMTYSQGGTPVTSPTNAGSYDVSAAINNSNYQGTTTGVLVISKADQTIIFNAPTGKTYGDDPLTLSATGGASGNAVTFDSQTPLVCSVSGNTLTILAAGPCSIRASQAGSGNYNEATPVSQTFSIARANQTISFGNLADKIFADPDFTVSATASSGLSVSFAASGPCSISGVTVNLTGFGPCTITASQGGDSNYNAAPSVARTFDIAQIINGAPDAVDDALTSVAEDSGVRTIAIASLLSNDSMGTGNLANESGQTLTLSVIGGSGIGGTVTGDSTNVYFTPAANYNGPASFRYLVTDNGKTNGQPDPKSDTATVSFNVTDVNDAPTAVNDPLVNVAEDSGQRTIPFTTLIGNDSTGPANESGQTLTVKTVSNAVGGTVGILGGNVIFMPSADFNGPASFQYTVEDNGTSGGVADPRTSAPGTVSFTITEVNDAPVTVNDTLGSIAEDAAPRAIPFADLTGNDTKGAANESGQSLTVISVNNAVGGSTLLVSGFVVFTPTENYSGPASFEYIVADNGTTNGVADPRTSGTAVVEFNISEVNDLPTAVADTLGDVAEDSGERAIPFADLTSNDAQGPANESGQTLIVKTVSNPIGVTVSIVAGTVRITPLPNYSGVASFQYTVEDDGTTNGVILQRASGPATVSFNISAVADTPSVTNATTNANTQTSAGLVISRNPADGVEVTHFKITAITGGTLFQHNGTTPINNGDFITFAEGNAGLKFSAGATNGSFTVQAATSATDMGLGGGMVTANITVNPSGGVIRFSESNYSVAEGAGSKTITVERTGDASQAVTVDYASSDHSNPADFLPCTAPGAGLASSRCDFTAAVGRLQFAAGETSKTFNVLIIDDNYVEGTETLELTLSHPTGGAVFGEPSSAILSLTDDATEGATNPIDNASDFVRSLYHDILNREPDPPGLAFWTDNIEKCHDVARRPLVNETRQTVAECIDKQRESTAVAFFMSPEFQITGGFVYHMYKGSLTGVRNFDGGSAGRFPTALEFMRDVSQVSEGIVVNNQLDGTVVEANRNRLAADFVQRPEFVAKYGGLNDTLYVDELFNTTGTEPTAAEKQALVDGLTNGTETRASVLRKVVDGTVVISETNVQFTTTYGQAFSNQEYRRVFVYMEYVGYLRRNPDALGFIFWLGKLNQFNGDPFQAEMVRAFILSPEYRSRFGQP